MLLFAAGVDDVVVALADRNAVNTAAERETGHFGAVTDQLTGMHLVAGIEIDQLHLQILIFSLHALSLLSLRFGVLPLAII